MAAMIPLEEAIELTHAFQQSEIGKNQTISAVFEKNIIEQILNQDGCEGIRIYNALNDEGKITFVLVGYDKDEKDKTDGFIADHAFICPPNCTNEKSPLNSI